MEEERGKDTRFRLFVYGTLMRGGPASHLLADCVREGAGEVEGTLYDIDGRYPALMLYGRTRVVGEVWRCPVAVLPRLDDHEGIAEGLFRRVAVEVQGRPCWTYVAGPGLSRRLVPERRMVDGVWQGRSTRPEPRDDDGE